MKGNRFIERMKNNIFEVLSKEEKEVLSAIQRKREIGKEDLLYLTDYKSTTMNRILDKLRGSKLIVVSGEGESTGGRRPLLYSLNSNMRIYSIGINIALNHVDVLIMHYSGNILCSKTVYIEKNMGPDCVLDMISGMFEECLEEYKIMKEEIYIGGLSVAAAINKEKGIIIESNCADFLNEITGTAVIMDVSTIAGCIGEYIFGLGENYEKISFLICRSTFRVGCMHKGLIIRSQDNVDDTFGHIVLMVGGRKCFCGNYGCLNAYASITTIVDDFIHELNNGRHSSLQEIELSEIDGGMILEAGERGDQLAVEIITKAAAMLGIGVSNYIKLVNPDLLILSGELVRKSRLYFETVKITAEKQLSFSKSRKTVVFKMRSEMGKATAGAATMGIEGLLDHFY